MGGGVKEITCLSLHRQYKNDSCIKMGSNESYFNVSLIVRDKVTRQCPQTTTFEEKGELKRILTEVPLLTSLMPCRWAKPAHTCSFTMLNPFCLLLNQHVAHINISTAILHHLRPTELTFALIVSHFIFFWYNNCLFLCLLVEKGKLLKICTLFCAVPFKKCSLEPFTGFDLQMWQSGSCSILFYSGDIH